MTLSKSTARGTLDRRFSTGLSRCGWRLAAIAGLSALLSACGVSQLTDPLQSGIFGGEKAEGEAANDAPLTTASIDGGQNQKSGGPAGKARCPKLNISTGSKTITFHAPGLNKDNLSVMHRGEITNTARECGASSAGLAIKYGISGRVLLGPKGKPGSITLPAKVTVAEGTKVVKTEKVRVVVNVPAGSTAGYFSEVREIDIRVPPGLSVKDFRVFVGFDKSGKGAS